MSVHPNAGLPNEFGEYDQTPEEFTSEMARFAQHGWVNIAGGCCGTTPDHIRVLAQTLSPIYPRTKGYTPGASDQSQQTPTEVADTIHKWSQKELPGDKPTFELRKLRDILSQIEDEETYYKARKAFKKEEHLYHSEQAMLLGAQLWGRFQYLRVENRLSQIPK